MKSGWFGRYHNMLTWLSTTVNRTTTTIGVSSSLSSYREGKTTRTGTPHIGSSQTFVSQWVSLTTNENAQGIGTSVVENYLTSIGTSGFTSSEVNFTRKTSESSNHILITSAAGNKTSTWGSTTYTSSQETINSTGGSTTSSTENISEESGSSSTNYTYQLEELTTTSFTSFRSTTQTLSSTYRIISASSIVSTSKHITSTIKSITTFTTTISQSTVRSIAAISTFTRQTITLGSTQDHTRPFTFVTAASAQGNEIGGVAVNTFMGFDIATNIFRTFTGISTFQPSYKYYAQPTFVMPTKQVTWVIDSDSVTTSQIDKVQITIDSKSSRIFNIDIDANGTEGKQIALSSFVTPFTDLNNESSSSFSISESTATTASTTNYRVGASYLTITTITNQITFTTLTAVLDSSFTYIMTENKGWTTNLTSTINTVANFIGDSTTVATSLGNPFGFPPLIHTGFSTSNTFSATFTADAITSNTSSVTSSFSSTFEAGGNYEADKNIVVELSVLAHTLGGAIAASQRWEKSYSNTAFLPPNQNFSFLSPGSNLTPDIPSEYKIPITYGARTDGAVTPLILDSSAVLSFIRNSTGGFGASVTSTAYTTYLWKYSSRSLTITTKRTSTTIVEADIQKTTFSSSTSCVLHYNGNASTFYARGTLIPSPVFTEFADSRLRYMPIGGRQRFSPITYNKAPFYVIGTTYSTNGNSGTYTSLIDSALGTFQLETNEPFSVEQIVTYFHIMDGNIKSLLGNNSTTFERNYTRAIN